MVLTKNDILQIKEAINVDQVSVKMDKYTVFKSQFYHPKLTFYLTSYPHHPITSNKNTAMACLYHPKLAEDMILKSVLDGKTET